MKGRNEEERFKKKTQQHAGKTMVQHEHENFSCDQLDTEQTSGSWPTRSSQHSYLWLKPN